MTFEHFSGLDETTCFARLSNPETAATVPRGCGRAEECLLPPSSSAVTAGLASAAVVEVEDTSRRNVRHQKEPPSYSRELSSKP